jgi:hypothetical protein
MAIIWEINKEEERDRRQRQCTKQNDNETIPAMPFKMNDNEWNRFVFWSYQQ